jgi:hypothetical protein
MKPCRRACIARAKPGFFHHGIDASFRPFARTGNGRSAAAPRAKRVESR